MKFTLDEKDKTEFQLVSLTTGPQTSGNISGSGFIGTSISGSIGPESYASFAYKDSLGDIRVISVPCSKIVFREGDKPVATVYKEKFYYKLAFRKKARDGRWYSGKEDWIIEVPSENITKYIRVN
jgi:hypothetical protein